MAIIPSVSHFCCCLSLKAGAYIIGCVTICFGLGLVISSALANTVAMFSLNFWIAGCSTMSEDGDCNNSVGLNYQGLWISCGLTWVLVGETPSPVQI
jgi:hypothetical protein